MNQNIREKEALMFGHRCLDWEFAKHEVRIVVRPKSERYSIKRDFLDLEAVVVIYNAELEAWLEYSPNMLELLDISEDELFDTACHNLMYDCVIMRIDSMLKDDTIDGEFMYVATNTHMTRGAGVMYSTEILDGICKRLGVRKIFVIPSSIHEIICTPYMSGEDDLQFVNHMINEVNATSVSVDERLSDHVYIYDSDLKKVYF